MQTGTIETGVLNLAEEGAKDPGTLFVCLMGVGIVFVGLVCLVFICKLLGLVINRPSSASSEPKVESAPQQSVASAPVAAPIQNRQELIAAISAAIAEENGTEVSGIRILSVKKL